MVQIAPMPSRETCKAWKYLSRVGSADIEELKKNVKGLKEEHLLYLQEGGMIDKRIEQEKTIYFFKPWGTQS